MWAGAAAVFTGSAYLAASKDNNDSTTTCAAADDNTVVGMLQGIAASVANIEATLGSAGSKQPQQNRRHGIDVVLGAQWGDEGKGKLVDMLSQVGNSLVTEKCTLNWGRRSNRRFVHSSPDCFNLFFDFFRVPGV